MRAVNLVPVEARSGGVTPGRSGGVVYGVIGGLCVLLAGASLVAIERRETAEAQQQLTSLQQSTQAYQAAATQFATYQQASQRVAARIETVRELSEARFDWAGSLRDIARLVPSNTQLASLSVSVKPGVGSGGSSGVRGALPSPAIEFTGCSESQRSVAQLMTQLEAMRRVTNVTLESSKTTSEKLYPTPEEAVDRALGNDKGSSSDGSDGEGGGSDCTLDAPYFAFSLTVFLAAGDARASTDVAAAPEAQTAAATEPAGATSSGS